LLGQDASGYDLMQSLSQLKCPTPSRRLWSDCS